MVNNHPHNSPTYIWIIFCCVIIWPQGTILQSGSPVVRPAWFGGESMDRERQTICLLPYTWRIAKRINSRSSTDQVKLYMFCTCLMTMMERWGYLTVCGTEPKRVTHTHTCVHRETTIIIIAATTATTDTLLSQLTHSVAWWCLIDDNHYNAIDRKY
jgi:hypothetical protein